MALFRKELGRRQVISLSSMALGAGILVKPSELLFAAGGVPQTAGKAKRNGTKYGKYITLSEKSEPAACGINMFPTIGDFPGFSTVIIGRMPPPGPMPGHDAPEKHDGEVELCMGEEKEKHTFNKSALVWFPPPI
jgi:hypothetical protein